MKQRFLFFGGPWDGQSREFEYDAPDPPYQLCVMPPMTLNVEFNARRETWEATTEAVAPVIYYRARVVGRFPGAADGWAYTARAAGHEDNLR